MEKKISITKEQILEKMGYVEGRKVDINKIIEEFNKENLKYNDLQLEFLRKYAFIEFTAEKDYGLLGKDTVKIIIDPLKAFEVESIDCLNKYKHIFGPELVAIAYANSLEIFYINSDGELYLIIDSFVISYGKDIVEMFYKFLNHYQFNLELKGKRIYDYCANFDIIKYKEYANNLLACIVKDVLDGEVVGAIYSRLEENITIHKTSSNIVAVVTCSIKKDGVLKQYELTKLDSFNAKDELDDDLELNYCGEIMQIKEYRALYDDEILEVVDAYINCYNNDTFLDDIRRDFGVAHDIFSLEKPL